nr:hypothetical protein [Tanacetum cinerariifolium]
MFGSGRRYFSNCLSSRLQEIRPSYRWWCCFYYKTAKQKNIGLRIGVRSSVSWIESGMVGASFEPYSWTAYSRHMTGTQSSLTYSLTLRVNAYVVFETKDIAQVFFAHNMAVHCAFLATTNTSQRILLL